ncbi:TetR/AcrR family transcriptional regulator [Mycobacterium barrassiae]|uniref:TetR/AcrR family transcriptional regulator n=1 Tax=Mycobacterium barrassiae TaxID=319709 RepID=UPI002265B955|nr:TetR/AcrR family transcriptional regulator [Mycobacterium barrassiae]MCV7301282.1 TetR/AcrR family transcriptional regulator [Mycobacterium barrassiae]
MTAADTAQKTGQARRDELRARVLSVIERQLRSGATYADIGVAGVVAEAGISRSTFYAYFVDKTNLLRTWYAEFTQVILDAAQGWWSLDGTATKKDVHVALERIVEAYRAHPELMAATHEAIGTDHGVREAVDDAMRRYIDGLRTHIETGQSGGFIDPSLPAAETAYWLQWMAERGLHRMLRAEAGSSQDRLAEAYAGIVWNTLYAPTRG